MAVACLGPLRPPSVPYLFILQKAAKAPAQSGCHRDNAGHFDDVAGRPQHASLVELSRIELSTDSPKMLRSYPRIDEVRCAIVANQCTFVRGNADRDVEPEPSAYGWRVIGIACETAMSALP